MADSETDYEFEFLSVEQRRSFLIDRLRSSETAYYDYLMNAEAFEAVVGTIPPADDPTKAAMVDPTRTQNLQQAQHNRMMANSERAKLDIYRRELAKLPAAEGTPAPD